MRYLHILLLAVLLLASCGHTDEPKPDPEEEYTVDQTVIMFFPWSSNLKSYFIQNIADFSDAITDYASTSKNVIVCIESTPGEADIISLKYRKGVCKRDTIEHYLDPQFTTVSGLTNMFDKITKASPSDKYSMIIGCHGMGWLPVTRASARATDNQLMHYEYPNSLTRYFGGASSEYQIEITDLAQAISDAGLKFEYILFDDCYMSSVEAAYDLRNATHYLIACPTEIMNYGFPYHKCGQYLLQSSDYDLICQAFYDFYINYEYPYGTIAITDCSELENLATTVRAINTSETAEFNSSDIQVMDGYSPTIFYDLADVMEHKTTDATLLDNFLQQLDKTVPYKAHTPRFFAQRINGSIAINTYCGITTSEISTNSRAATVKQTAWYKATH